MVPTVEQGLGFCIFPTKSNPRKFIDGPDFVGQGMACTGGVPPIATPRLLNSNGNSKIRQRGCAPCCYCSSATNSSITTTNTSEGTKETSKKFSYSRASPSVRWPHRKLTDTNHHSQFTVSAPTIVVDGDDDNANFPRGIDEIDEEGGGGGGGDGGGGGGDSVVNVSDETLEVLGRPSRTRAKKMTKLALKRANDWRQRVQFLTDRILRLNSDEFVADVLDERKVLMTPTDFCFVVKLVGQSSWQRAMEVYEWLNLRQWYSPNARMLATILSVLGKANQEALAVEIYTRAELGAGNTVQVYNAMMGVYARNGRFTKVQELLDLMRTRGCEPDLVSFNTLINARSKSGLTEPNSALEFLSEMRRSGIRPDIITYNTLISACSRNSNLEEAAKVFSHMEANKCQPDLWTYNAMLSVYGRCGQSSEAEQLFKELGSKGFFPDAVTYNSLVYAFAREGNIDKVKEICDEMVKMGFGENEMTLNTIIHMYGKQGQHDLALKLYRDMKSSGRDPDVVTYTVLIDSLGKANKISEAANVMSEMLNAGVKPTLRTYSALICGYAKAGKRLEAVETYACMLSSGIKPDRLAYTVMLDIHLRSNEPKKAMSLYHKMVCDGFTPDLSLYEAMLRDFGKENMEECVHIVVKDMEELCDLNRQVISSVLVKAECYDYAAKVFRSAILQGYDLDRENLLSILSSYSSAGRHSEALELLDFLKENAVGSDQLITEALIVILCNSHQLEAALSEYNKSTKLGLFSGTLAMYKLLIKCCEESELFSEASQLFSDMSFIGVDPSDDLYRTMVHIYCKMGFPETASCLVHQAEAKGIKIDNISIYVGFIEAYGKLKLLEKAESVVGSLRQKASIVDRKAWNALIQAYAVSGSYEKARAAFNTMMRDGPSPTVESIDGLLQALIVDGRLKELYVVIQELQDMGFKISKGSIILMLEAFAQAGDLFEVKKIYHGMKAAGYYPTMHLYRVMIGLFSRGKRVQDVEAMVYELEEAGFKPDLSIYNILLKLYTKIEDFRKTAQVYQQIQEAGLNPDDDTYSTLIVMYCRDCRPEEGLLLMHEMRGRGLAPKLSIYKSLIAAFAKQKMLKEAEEIFQKLQLEGHKLDRSFYHLMMKLYRSCGKHSSAEELLVTMKEAGVEPNSHTMHLLMISYGSSGNPKEAEKVLDNLKSSAENLSTLPYSSVINAYLKNGDYNVGVQKLLEMKREGLEADHRIWTCFIRAASLCQSKTEAMILLNVIADAGCDIPIRYFFGSLLLSPIFSLFWLSSYFWR